MSFFPLLLATLTLSWTDNSSNETGMVVQRSLDGTTWTEVARLSANVVTYQDLAVEEGKTYRYRVAAFNAAGQSAWSNVATGTAPLKAPSNLTVTANPIAP